ncbi:hypothetical protein DIS24_g11403 [Lasiodiplodia hormozganensis]|uniref:Uncharacterized protein n=1 Tax=Lasiodiplodia hormozganensis TaxID=869390 RepID=A0AA39WV26_9PEZI|nr:hypothetical protein DIS24_g11403 [Lasiodiplodia hormozganensis]
MGDYPERPTNENPTPRPNGIHMYRRYYQDPAAAPPTAPLPTRPTTTTGGRISRIIEIIDVTDLPNGVHHEQPPLIAPAQPSRDNSNGSARTNASTLTSAPTYDDDDDDDDDDDGSLSGSVRRPVTSSPALVVVEERVHRMATAEATSGDDQPNDYGTAVPAPSMAHNSRFSRVDEGEEEEEYEEREGEGEEEGVRARRRGGERGELEDV